MTTHLYCVLPHDWTEQMPAGLSGVSGARVRALPVDGLVAWVSDVERGLPLSVDGIKAHDAVVEAALEMGMTPVPARFGQRFANDDECRAALERRASSVESVLQTLQGFVEMTLILTPSTRRMLRELEPALPEIAESGAGEGRRYLEGIRAREAASGTVKRALDELARALDNVAHEFVERSARNDQSAKLPIVTISHLIGRNAIEPYREAIQTVEPNAEFRFLLIGPRAPYSFCGLGPSDGAHGMKLAD
jgi:hypothetical protein